MADEELDPKSYYLEFAKNIAAAAQQRFTGGPSIDAIVCQVEDTPLINARVCKISNLYEYKIEIFTGLITSLAQIFQRCIDHADFPYTKLAPRNGLVNENARLTLFRTLIEHAFAFVTLHELAHVINGHLVLRASVGSVEMMDEIEDECDVPQPLTRFDLQTMEVDADGTAAVFLTGRVLEIAANPGEVPQEQNNSCYLTPDVALEILLFSIFCFFGAAGYRVFNVAEAERLKHPPSAVRQISLVHALERFTGTRLPGRLTSTVAQIAIKAQVVWSQFAAAAADREILSAQLNDPGPLEYAAKLNANWGKLLVQLEPLKHGGVRRDRNGQPIREGTKDKAE